MGCSTPGSCVPSRSVSDLGLTHIALPVHDIDVSIDFYARYAGMEVVHRRDDPGGNRVAWVSDLTRPFVVVLIETARSYPSLGDPFSHLGIALASRDAVDRVCELARAEDRAVHGPVDSGPPVGYWAYVVDPDGHNLEVSFGQEVAFTVEDHTHH